MAKLLKRILVCTLFCAMLVSMAPALAANVCSVYGSQHKFNQENYEKAHPHKEYLACKCGHASYTGGNRKLDDCTECYPVVCSIYGSQHKITEESYEKAHPHKEYEACKCGYAIYTGGTRKLEDCTECYPVDDECNHRWSKYGYCLECDIDCPHPETLEKTTKDNGKSISDTEHRYTEIYDLFCSQCKMVLDEDLTKVSINPHKFDSNGECTMCEYAKNPAACTHSKEDLELLTVSYEAVDGTKHQVKEVSSIVCANANCGKLIEYGGNIETYQEKHTFKNNVCSKCGYTKYDAMSVSISRGSSSSVVGSGISASCSVSGGSGSFEYSWTATCGGATMASTDYGAGSSHSFSATKAGSWKISVTVRDKITGKTVKKTTSAITVKEPECTHAAYTEVAQPEKEYVKLSDSKHTVKTTYDRVCDKCGKILSTYTKSDSENHTYKNGNCTRCGAAEPTPVCEHSSKKSTELSRSVRKTSSSSQHAIDITWKDVCASCGVTLNTTRTTYVMEDHTFNSKDVCSCGYTKPTPTCDHASPEKIKISSKTVKADDNKHMVTTVYQLKCKCGVVVKENHEEYAYFNHTLEGGKCQACGYACAHGETDKAKIDSRTEMVNDQQHKVTTVYQVKCSTCGAVVNKQYEQAAYFEHTIEGGKCKYCGFESTVVPEAVCSVHGSEHVYDYTGYEKDHPHKIFQRCDCGNARYTGETKILNDCLVCTPCDHKPEIVSMEIHYEQINEELHKEVETALWRCACGETEYTAVMRGTALEHVYPDMGANMPQVPGRETSTVLKCEKCGFTGIIETEEPLDVDPHDQVNIDKGRWGDYVNDKEVFDYENIVTAVYLNASKSADLKGDLGVLAYAPVWDDDGNAGHAAVMLIDKNGNSVYFSVNGKESDGKISVGMRYMEKEETNEFLDTGKMKPMMYRSNLITGDEQKLYFVSDKYANEMYSDSDYAYVPVPSVFLETNDQEGLKKYLIDEGIYSGDDAYYIQNMELYADDSAYHYNRAILYPATAQEGKSMYKQVMMYTNGNYQYDFIEENCDYYALYILDDTWFVDADQQVNNLLPNETYFWLEYQAYKNEKNSGIVFINDGERYTYVSD